MSCMLESVQNVGVYVEILHFVIVYWLESGVKNIAVQHSPSHVTLCITLQHVILND